MLSAICGFVIRIILTVRRLGGRNMGRRKVRLGLLFLGVLGVAGLAFLRPWEPVPIGPSKANFDRIQIGIPLAEAEAFLGPAGLSYSSDTSYEYYIWKSKEKWVSVIVKDGKLTSTHIRPSPD
jgi:hypothetical protein